MKPLRPEHSEVYWQAMKYAIIGLGTLMVIVLLLAIVILVRVIPWG